MARPQHGLVAPALMLGVLLAAAAVLVLGKQIGDGKAGFDIDDIDTDTVDSNIDESVDRVKRQNTNYNYYNNDYGNNGNGGCIFTRYLRRLGFGNVGGNFNGNNGNNNAGNIRNFNQRTRNNLNQIRTNGQQQRQTFNERRRGSNGVVSSSSSSFGSSRGGSNGVSAFSSTSSVNGSVVRRTGVTLSNGTTIVSVTSGDAK